jgi:hypothetical protein
VRIHAISLIFGVIGSTNLTLVVNGLSVALPRMDSLALLAVMLFVAGFG